MDDGTSGRSLEPVRKKPRCSLDVNCKGHDTKVKNINYIVGSLFYCFSKV